MDLQIYTVHARPGQDLMAIADRFDLFALILPLIWALWHRLWLVTGGMILLLTIVALISPLAASPVLYGLALIFAFEGGAVRRFERRIWGWQEVGVVQAASAEGAEELYLNGQVA